MPTLEDKKHVTDNEFLDLLHEIIVDIVGLDENLVRRMYQTDPPAIPDHNIDWCSYGINADTPAGLSPFIKKTGENETEISETYTTEVLICFYGINATDNAKRLKNGLSVFFKREPLYWNRCGLASVGQTVRMTEQVNNQYYQRADTVYRFSRRIMVKYIDRNLESAVFQPKTETGDFKNE